MDVHKEMGNTLPGVILMIESEVTDWSLCRGWLQRYFGARSRGQVIFCCVRKPSLLKIRWSSISLFPAVREKSAPVVNRVHVSG